MISGGIYVKNKILVFFAVIINVFLLAGCTKATNTYTYDVENIDHYDSLYITQTTYYKDRVEITFKGTNSLDGYTLYSPDFTDSREVTKRNKLIIYADDPSKIHSVIAKGSWIEVYFRYLDSDEYATIWHTWADDIGWTGEKGDKDKYYTPQEKDLQRKTASQIAVQKQLAEQESKDILEIIKGRWVNEDGSYFDITEGDRGRCLFYYDVKEDYLNEFSGISFSWISEDENKIDMYERPEGWGAWYSYEIELSEDGKSFDYDSQTYYFADEAVWGSVDVEYINPVRVLFNNADEWKVTKAQDEVKEADETDEEESENAETVCKYAVTDLDMNGLSEVLVSGISEDGTCFLEVYEATEDGSIEKKKTDDTLLQPALYNAEELRCLCLSNRYQDVYKYYVEGRTDHDEESCFIQNYLMSIQINSLVLEKSISQESTDAENVTYYNDKDEEISEKQYNEYKKGIEGEFNKTIRLSWFDEITIENMAQSMGVFLESMNYEEE